MAKDRYGFDEQSVKRIIRSVLAEERRVQNRPKHWERYNTRRGIGGGSGGIPFSCLIDNDIAAATMDGSGVVTPTYASATLLERGSGQLAPSHGITVEWIDLDTVTVGSGKARLGKGVEYQGTYELFVVTCDEADYGTGT